MPRLYFNVAQLLIEIGRRKEVVRVQAGVHDVSSDGPILEREKVANALRALKERLPKPPVMVGDPLTETEQAVGRLVVERLSDKEIAGELDLGWGTERNVLRSLVEVGLKEREEIGRRIMGMS